MLDALLFTKTPGLFRMAYPRCLWKADTGSKTLYLTFDDGPIPEVTPWVLEQLKKLQAKATFFCIGKNIATNPKIFRQIIKDGHSIGNHTFDHLNGWKNSNSDYFKNITACDNVLTAQKTPKRDEPLFRPPYGKLTPFQYRRLFGKYKIVMWDVLSLDFDLNVSKTSVLKNVLKNSEPGSIIVFHDSLKAQAKLEYALPRLLEHFSSKGFMFDKL
jgi:peptidoglycan/xylan/chitin deacetylase (PgdA/CDA1 family)